MMDTFQHGWDAAANNEPRSYAEEVGPKTAEGWDAYWEEYGPDY